MLAMMSVPGASVLAASCCCRIVSNWRMRCHFSVAVNDPVFATTGQSAAIATFVSSAYEMLGFSICNLLIRSLISLVRSTLRTSPILAASH